MSLFYSDQEQTSWLLHRYFRPCFSLKGVVSEDGGYLRVRHSDLCNVSKWFVVVIMMSFNGSLVYGSHLTYHKQGILLGLRILMALYKC